MCDERRHSRRVSLLDYCRFAKRGDSTQETNHLVSQISRCDVGTYAALPGKKGQDSLATTTTPPCTFSESAAPGR